MTSAYQKPADKNYTRRELLQDALRYGCLAGLSLLGLALLARRHKTLPEELCRYQNLCQGCREFENCFLPAALSAKRDGLKPSNGKR